ncbi:signal peptidase II [Paenibacillus sambharensis]|uniref:Lipoprotein signal peptidase n=1 Tax=Paenibacillus sambharensis TaxID=1803190 RepID=A0A2W1LPW7_9BACL|nr:signal peptidase II [Paenibacillus sambharensis]PZD93871.1 signal peptidase II [Paenibacillus sambharensis]
MKGYYYWIALAVFIIDQVTKRIIATQLELAEQIPVIGNFFIITSHRNPGAAFGILKEQTTLFIIVTLLVVAGIIWYIQKNRHSGNTMLLVALGLVLGGAFGNFLDRALYGEVVDFLQFNFGSYTFPIFNVADMGIVIGVGLILLDTILDMKNDYNKTKQDGAAAEDETRRNADPDESVR